jgi:SprT protein
MNELLDTIEQTYLRAEQYYNKKFVRPSIDLNLKGTTAGYANYLENKLQFNRGLYTNNKEHFLKQTVPHEVAHLISVAIYGYTKGRGHGAAWKSVMLNCFGLAPTRCHRYDVTEVRVRQVARNYVYRCACRAHHLTTIKHNRILKGAAYRCCSCKQTIQLIHIKG